MPCVSLNAKAGLLTKEGYYSTSSDGQFVTIEALPAQAEALGNAGLPVVGRVAVPNAKPPVPASAPPAPPTAATAPTALPTPSAAPSAPPAAAAAPSAPPASAPVTPPAAAPVTAKADGPPPEDLEVNADHTKTTRGRGRPAAGFTLVLAGGPERGFSEKDVYFLDQVLHLYGQELAAASGVSSYYDLHPFKRRDAVCAKVADFAEQFGKGTVFAKLNESPDLDQFITALRPLAKRVIGSEFSPMRIE